MDAENLTPQPADVPREATCASFVAGTTACVAVRAVDPRDSDTEVVSAAAGGVGTVADFAATKKHGVKAEGTAAAASAEVLAELACMIAGGRLDGPVAAVFAFGQVRDAYRELEERHTPGTMVVRP